MLLKRHGLADSPNTRNQDFTWIRFFRFEITGRQSELGFSRQKGFLSKTSYGFFRVWGEVLNNCPVDPRQTTSSGGTRGPRSVGFSRTGTTGTPSDIVGTAWMVWVVYHDKFHRLEIFGRYVDEG